jgi:hypothetical protein
MRPTPKAGAARHGEGDEGVSNLNRGLVYHVRLGALHNFVIEWDIFSFVNVGTDRCHVGC